MDGRTDKKSLGNYSTGHCPSRAAALLTIGKSERIKKSRARVLLSTISFRANGGFVDGREKKLPTQFPSVL